MNYNVSVQRLQSIISECEDAKGEMETLAFISDHGNRPHDNRNLLLFMAAAAEIDRCELAARTAIAYLEKTT